MFQKIKNKIAEDVKPFNFQSSVQQFTNAVTSNMLNTRSDPTNNLIVITDNSEVENLNSNSTQDDGEFTTIDLKNTIPSTGRRISTSSTISDIFPVYEPSYLRTSLQSDFESASEFDDSSSVQVENVTKENLYNSYRKVQQKYNKYRGRYVDLLKFYKELEHENVKAKKLLSDTQDKAIQRITELKEQCVLERKAKAHLEEELRADLEEKDHFISTLNSKIDLLKNIKEDSINQKSKVFDTNSTNKSTSVGTLIDLSENAANEKNNMSEPKNNLLKDKEKHYESLLSKAKEAVTQKNQRIQDLTTQLNEQRKEQEEQNDKLKKRLESAEKEITSLQQTIDGMKKKEEESALSLAENKLTIHKELEEKESQIKVLENNIFKMLKENQILQQKVQLLDSSNKTKLVSIENTNAIPPVQKSLSRIEEESKFLSDDMKLRIANIKDDLLKYLNKNSKESNQLSAVNINAASNDTSSNESENRINNYLKQKRVYYITLENKNRLIDSIHSARFEASKDDFSKTEVNSCLIKLQECVENISPIVEQEDYYYGEQLKITVKQLADEIAALRGNRNSDSNDVSINATPSEGPETETINSRDGHFDNSCTDLSKSIAKAGEESKNMETMIVHDYGDTVKKLEISLSKKHKECNNIRIELEELLNNREKDLAGHKRAVEDSEMRYNQSVRECEQLKKTLSECENNLRKMTEKLEMRSASLEDYLKERTNLLNRIDLLRSDLDNVVSDKQSLLIRSDDDSGKIHHYEAMLTNYGEELQSKTDIIRRLTGENKKLKDNYDDLTKSAKTYLNSVRELKCDYQSIRQQCESNRETVRRSTGLVLERCCKTIIDYENNKKSDQTLESSNSEIISELRGEIESLKTAKFDREVNVTQLREENRLLNIERKKLGDESELYYRENIRLRELDSLYADATVKLSGIADEVKNELFAVIDCVDKLESSKSCFNRCKSIENISQKALNLSADYRTMKSYCQQHLCMLEKNFLNYKTDVIEALSKIKIENNDKHALVEKLQSDLEVARKNCTGLSDENNRLKDDNEKLSLKVNELSNSIDKCQAELESNRIREITLSGELSRLKEEHEIRLRQMAFDFENEIELKNRQYERLSNEKFEKQEKLETDVYRELHRIIKATQDDLQNKNAAFEKLLEEFEAYKQKANSEIEETKITNSAKLMESDKNWRQCFNEKLTELENKYKDEINELSKEWNKERKQLEYSVSSSGISMIESLQIEISNLNQELNETKKNHKKEMNDLQRLFKIPKENNAILDGEVSLEDCTEMEYLRNILYEYMMGKEPMTLARVLSAIVRFDGEQTQRILEKEEQKQSLLRNLTSLGFS